MSLGHDSAQYPYFGASILRLATSAFQGRRVSPRTVFVGGTLGVGKTSMCAASASATGAIHLTASALIMEARAEAIVSTLKRVHDVPNNQTLLLKQFEHVLNQGAPKRSVPMDGHYAVLNKDGDPAPIATEGFSMLGVTSLVCVRDEPVLGVTRLGVRDGNGGTLAAVASHQPAELAPAALVATALNIPLRVIVAFDEASLHQALEAVYHRP